MAYLFDTNIFVRLANQVDPQRSITVSALKILRARNEALCFTPQILNGFWNICTRPASARGGLGLSLKQTKRKAKLIEKYFQLLPDNLTTHLVENYSVMGVQVYDARLAASMAVYRIPHILTFNLNDFGRFPAITAIHPKDIR